MDVEEEPGKREMSPKLKKVCQGVIKQLYKMYQKVEQMRTKT